MYMEGYNWKKLQGAIIEKKKNKNNQKLRAKCLQILFYKVLFYTCVKPMVKKVILVLMIFDYLKFTVHGGSRHFFIHLLFIDIVYSPTKLGSFCFSLVKFLLCWTIRHFLLYCKFKICCLTSEGKKEEKKKEGRRKS